MVCQMPGKVFERIAFPTVQVEVRYPDRSDSRYNTATIEYAVISINI
jgi:hypothetical protein